MLSIFHAKYDVLFNVLVFCIHLANGLLYERDNTGLKPVLHPETLPLHIFNIVMDYYL